MKVARGPSLVEVDGGNNLSLAGIVHAVGKFARLLRVLPGRPVGSGNGAQIFQIVPADRGTRLHHGDTKEDGVYTRVEEDLLRILVPLAKDFEKPFTNVSVWLFTYFGLLELLFVGYIGIIRFVRGAIFLAVTVLAEGQNGVDQVGVAIQVHLAREQACVRKGK